MRRIALLLFLLCGFAASVSLEADNKLQPSRPNLEKIKAKTTDETSIYYYPKLLDKFMANDTLMTNEEFQYFYYGTLFQEDFDPYRPAYNENELKEITPLYYKSSHTRAEKDIMLKYAKSALADNPLDLEQLKNLVFVYEQNKKVLLAKIWKYKINKLLWVIASSGTGLDTEHAWTVVYPRHEFDFLNLSGLSVASKEFVEPYYERAFVNRRSEKDPEAYYFDIQAILEQYYLKHPSEIHETPTEQEESVNPVFQ